MVVQGWALMQATILNFLIEGSEDTNPLLLFAGVLAAFLAICSMALSDSHASSPDTEITARLSSSFSCSRSKSAVSQDQDQDQDTYKSLLSSAETGGEGGGEVAAKMSAAGCSESSGGGSGTRTSPWILVSIFSGFLAGLWSPLSTFGRSKGGYPVDNPSVALFFFQLGAVSGIPFMLWYYGRVIHVYEKPPFRNAPVSCSAYLQEAIQLPSSDKKYGLLAGAIVSCGTYIFFTASQAISSTVAFAISSCAPLVTIAIGVIVFHQLKNAPFLQTFYLILSTFLFVLAISLMVLANLLS
jgi:hypothetical protein